MGSLQAPCTEEVKARAITTYANVNNLSMEQLLLEQAAFGTFQIVQTVLCREQGCNHDLCAHAINMCFSSVASLEIRRRPAGAAAASDLHMPKKVKGDSTNASD